MLQLKEEIQVSIFDTGKSTIPLTSSKHEPGKVSSIMNTWTRDNTQGSYLGMTVHWIKVLGESIGKGKWESYLLALAKHVGIIDHN